MNDKNEEKITFEGLPKIESNDTQIFSHAEIDAITRNKIATASKIDNSTVDFLKGTPYEAVKGFSPKPINTANQFDATEIKPATEGEITFEGIPKAEINPTSNVEQSIVDFLKNAPITPFNYQPSPMPTPEQFDAAGKGLKDAAIKHMSKMRYQVGAVILDNNGKPKSSRYALSEVNHEQGLEPIDDKQYFPHAELGITSKKILEIREKSTETQPSTDNKNKPE